MLCVKVIVKILWFLKYRAASSVFHTGKTMAEFPFQIQNISNLRIIGCILALQIKRLFDTFVLTDHT
jgi:hypothetical protein